MEEALRERLAPSGTCQPIRGGLIGDPPGLKYEFASGKLGKKHNFLDHNYQKRHYYANEKREAVDERYSQRLSRVKSVVDVLTWPEDARGNVTVYFAGTSAKMGDYFSPSYFDGELVAFFANAALGMGQQPDDDLVAVDGISSGKHDHSNRLAEPHPDESELSSSAMFRNAHHALQALRHISFRKRITQINIMGWSRGGVTSIILANYLYNDHLLQHIPVNMFLIDPVPGWSMLSGVYAARRSVGAMFSEPLGAAASLGQGVQQESQHGEVTSAWGILQKNVKHATIIYAGDERTQIFSPVRPRICDQGKC
jgi:hypothetical protein